MERKIKDDYRAAVIDLDGGECEVIFGSTYMVFAVNSYDNDVTISLEKGKTAGDDGVMVCPAGESIMYPHMQRRDRLYITGSGTVQVFASNEAVNLFKSKAKGGDRNESYMIYNQGKDMNGHTVSVYHTNSSSGKFGYGIRVWYWYGGVVITDLLDLRGYRRIGAAIRAIRQGTANPAQTIIGIYDNNEVTLGGSDYWTTNAAITDPVYVANVNDNTTNVGGVFYVDIPEGVNSGYWGMNTVNFDTYVYSIWLE